ncbi:MAG: helix-turn-helix transcriptional regulator [Butyrivibrio sp.]|nr:helix-turn-helix transcriptional regulator [Butyrivibrio sp.]
MNTQNMETIGGRLKALRLKEEFSQEQLADELSFGSKSMVSQYESNKRAITIDALLEYSNRFNVTTDWILKGVLAPAFVEPRELYKAFGYEDVIEVYSRIKDSQMQQVALAQLKVLAEF